eukprot:SAG31_NODE_6832_length_1875_cov_1.641892_1_plen_89_part_00
MILIGLVDNRSDIEEQLAIERAMTATAGENERIARAPAQWPRMKQTARKNVVRPGVKARGARDQVEGQDGAAAAAAQSKVFDPGGSRS